MNLLDPYEPPKKFKVKKSTFDKLKFHVKIDVSNQPLLEELDRPLVTEDYSDSPFADREEV